MAEAIANDMFGDLLAASSAGSEPKGHPHPLALATLRAHGLSTERAASKHVETFSHESFDLVITLCDHARQSCPTLPGAASTTHWGLADPSEAGPRAEDMEDAFEATFAALVEAIESLVSPPHYDLAAKAQIVERRLREKSRRIEQPQE